MLKFTKNANFTKPKKYYEIQKTIPKTSLFTDSKYVIRIGFNILVYPFHRSPKKFLTNSGYVALKFGQWISTHTDILPEKIRKNISDLQNHTIKPVDNLIGSGTIANVYLIDHNGKKAVKKVVRNGIKNEIENELSFYRKIFMFLNRFNFFRSYELEKQFDEFSNSITAQIDLRNEAKNLFILSKIKEIIVPKVFYCDSDVIIEEYIECDNKPTTNYVKNCICLVVKFLNSNLIHTDLHPGNIKRFKDDRVVLFDAGMVKLLNYAQLKNLQDLVYAFLYKKDAKLSANLLIERSYKNKKVNKKLFVDEFSCLSKKHFFETINSANKEKILFNFSFCNMPYGKIYEFKKDFDYLGIVNDFHSLFKKYGVVLDSSYFCVFGSFLCLEGGLKEGFKNLSRNEIVKVFQNNLPISKFLWYDFCNRFLDMFKIQS